ncbi:hypothetical protein ACR6C2_44395 [Streptomyces sp. INA 01156]
MAGGEQDGRRDVGDVTVPDPQQVGVDLPRVCRIRVSGSVRTWSSPPSASTSARCAADANRGSGTATSPRATGSAAHGSTPSRSRNSPITVSGSGVARAGSPSRSTACP